MNLNLKLKLNLKLNLNPNLNWGSAQYSTSEKLLMGNTKVLTRLAYMM